MYNTHSKCAIQNVPFKMYSPIYEGLLKSSLSEKEGNYPEM